MPTFQPNGYWRASGGFFRFAQSPAPSQPSPLEAIQPQPGAPAPEQPSPLSGSLLSDTRASFGYTGPSSAPVLSDPGRAEYQQTIAPVSSGVSERQLVINARPDLAQAISDDNLALQTIWRSSISEAPNIRGFKDRQIYAQLNGQYFEPVRWDLDTIVNKIDPGIVQDTIIVEGPYAVQYGPGFTFMDIVTRPTPRNQRAQYRSSMSWIPNGRQIYGRETVSGGGENFGYRLSYGHRNGYNYTDGNGNYIPSHYNFGDVLAEFSYYLDTSRRIDAIYNRVDMNHTAYPGQFFDVSSLQTNAYNLRYVDEDVTMPWTRLTIQGWYNNNTLTGNTFDNTKQPIVNTVDYSLTNYFIAQEVTAGVAPQTSFSGFAGGTVGNLASTGGRIMAQFGELDEVSLLVGGDTRVIDQRVSEYMTINQEFVPTTGSYITDQFTTGMPRARSINPGGFAEMTLPWTSYFRTKIGGRGDYLETNAYASSLPQNQGNGLPPLPAYPPNSPLSKANGMYAYYIVNQLDITQNWNAAFSFGESQRPPSLIDRYADGMFLGIIQSGFRRVIGDPNLQPSKNYQIDAQINGKYENWRGFLRGYNSWVNNFVTYSQDLFPDPTGAVLLHTMNTPQAQLRGFEGFTSFDLTPRITPFASAHYVYAEDVSIHQALFLIPPLQGTAGIRFHDPNGGGRWGLEFFALITRQQDRNARLRLFNPPPGVVLAPTTIEQQTPGWTTYNMRGYWNVSRNLMLSGGINNMFGLNYITYGALRTGPLNVYSPGVSPYVSMEWIY